MFATILRRWRLSAPLALISMVSIVVGAMALTPASAHGADKPVTFSGYAAGALVHINTPFSLTEANAAACFTGKVSKHGSTLIKVAAGEPVIIDPYVQQSNSDFNEKFAAFTKCFAEVKSHKTGDGTGKVLAEAVDLGVAPLFGPNSFSGIRVFDDFAPPFTVDTIDIPGTLAKPAQLATDAEAFCNKEGTAKAAVSFNATSSTGNIVVITGGVSTSQPILNIANQPLVGLPAGVSATLNEVSANVSGDHASVTVIGLHVTAAGVDARLAVSHADIKCPK